MRSFTASLLALAAASAVSAQSNYPNQTLPFNLVLKSAENSTLDGLSLATCHEGSAIDGLCFGPKLTVANASFPVFNFNYSTEYFVANYSLGITGLLTHVLRGSNFNLSEPLLLSVNPASNVAHPQFSPSATGTIVAFNSSGYLNIQSFVDDTVVPASSNRTIAYYRWYACQSYSSGYNYHTLNWVYGNAAPQNPSCQKVDVLRLNITSPAY